MVTMMMMVNGGRRKRWRIWKNDDDDEVNSRLRGYRLFHFCAYRNLRRGKKLFIPRCSFTLLFLLLSLLSCFLRCWSNSNEMTLYMRGWTKDNDDDDKTIEPIVTSMIMDLSLDELAIYPPSFLLVVFLVQVFRLVLILPDSTQPNPISLTRCTNGINKKHNKKEEEKRWKVSLAAHKRCWCLCGEGEGKSRQKNVKL